MTDVSTADLERQAEAARARVADTAESLRNKMTPGQMMDEFTGMLSNGDAGAALRNLKGQVRDNPLPPRFGWRRSGVAVLWPEQQRVKRRGTPLWRAQLPRLG